MSGFTYMGKSTDTVIGDKLILASWDAVTETLGSERDSIIGSRTISRPIANEYGTTYTPASFTYTLIKENGEPITDAEQVTIETWLTSPKYSNTLTLFDDCSGDTIKHYRGKFVRTSWVSSGAGWAGVNFTFESVSAYAYEHRTITETVDGTKSITFDLGSDELEEYVYPVLTIYSTLNDNVIITNTTDGNSRMTVKTPPRVAVRIDCDKCIVTDDTISGVIDFEDLGWDNLENIYWLRLNSNGNNTLTLQGNATITLDLDIANKMVGGWL